MNNIFQKSKNVLSERKTFIYNVNSVFNVILSLSSIATGTLLVYYLSDSIYISLLGFATILYFEYVIKKAYLLKFYKKLILGKYISVSLIATFVFCNFISVSYSSYGIYLHTNKVSDSINTESIIKIDIETQKENQKHEANKNEIANRVKAISYKGKVNVYDTTSKRILISCDKAMERELMRHENALSDIKENVNNVLNIKRQLNDRKTYWILIIVIALELLFNYTYFNIIKDSIGYYFLGAKKIPRTRIFEISGKQMTYEERKYKACINCGKSLLDKNKHAKFCSGYCRTTHHLSNKKQ